MPPKKKETPKNGYYFLMLEHKGKEERRGRYITMKMAANEVQDQWACMDKAERDNYNKLAERYKLEKHFEKYNTLGMTFTELKRMQEEKEKDKMFMDAFIKDQVCHLNKNSTLRTKEFYLIHINYYCDTEGGDYFPAEIALAKFNLGNGVIETFHTYVCPGEFPVGYRYRATEHSNRTHKTPLDWERGETDLNKLFMNIKSFLKADGIAGDLPPVYTMPDNINTNASMSAVKRVLEELSHNQGNEPDLFKVFSLPKLFFELRNACDEDAFPTQTIAESELEKDVFNYTRGIACKFHEEEDVMQYCSLSTVQRWAYLICDHCCKDLDIELIPGNHCPKTADVHGNYKKVWRPRKEGQFDRKEDTSPPPPSVKEINKPITIIDASELRQPHKSSTVKRHTPGFAEVAAGEKPSTQSANCWSSIADRSNQYTSAPPTFDESNYPSIGGSRGSASNSSTSRYNAWSGRGRGMRGRGLAANFSAMNIQD